MPRASVLVLADLLTANRLPGFRIGRPAPSVIPVPPQSGGQPGVQPGESVGDSAASDWNLDALTGRLVEISSEGASVALTATTSLLLEAQLRREPAAWVAIGEATFYPPDLAEAGCDLESLPVVRVDDARTAARAADLLLRSGGFRLVVIDGLGSPYLRTRRIAGGSRAYPGYGPAYSKSADRQALDALEGSVYGREALSTIPPAAQTRLVGLTQRHRAVLVCITRKGRGATSLGPLVSFRGTGTVRKTAFDRFTWELEVLKDKRRAPGWEHSGVCRGPTGLF